MKTFDAIVTGAGIWGCTVARRLAEAGKKVLVLEKRAAVGGNCRCEIDPETGIEVHTYGSHIFHTSNEEVWKFVRRFTEFSGYRHCVLARTKKAGGESRWTAEARITSNWYDVIDPAVVEGMKCIAVPADANPPADRRAIKDVFQGFGAVENESDGRCVIFPAKSAGKMLCQSGIGIRHYVRSFAEMFRQSIRAWSEKEAEIESHKQHRNITAYHQYIVKAELGGSICHVRFTVREDAGGKVKQKEIHSSTVSRVTVYKAKGAELSGLSHAQVEDSTPFVDNKIAFFLKGVKGGGEESPESKSKSGIVTLHSSTSTSYFDSLHTYHLPIGCTLLKEFFGREIKPSEMTENERTQLFDAFIRGYTSKQWGVAPEKVDPSIIARLKVRDNYSTDYFDDPYQGIPSDGYNKMFERMLDHPNITVQCGCELVVEKVGGERGWTAEGSNPPLHAGAARERGSDFQVASLRVRGAGAEWINEFLARYSRVPRSDVDVASPVAMPIYYSGPIDALFNYKYGALPWRTLRFECETLPVADYQGNSVVNYTDAEVPFTRIHEFKHYHPEAEGQVEQVGGGGRCRCTVDVGAARERGSDVLVASPGKTIIMREYSAAWQKGDEPYYPIDSADSRALFAKYQQEVAKFNSPGSDEDVASPVLVIGGRLGGYKYFDMDKSIAAALAVEI